MIYENNVLKQILVDGGYITFSGTTPSYHYYLKDHLGNNRVVVSPSGTPLQVNHYYPFGGLFGESTGNSLQRFRFNGKEFDRTHGLDWYDYGARHMTPDVGRFTTIDPKAEKDYATSPYAYCGNNPLIRVDKDGKIWDTVLDVALTAIDVIEAGYEYFNEGSVSTTTKAALGADVAAILIPGFTGAGLAIREGAKTVDIGRAITKEQKAKSVINTLKKEPEGRAGKTIDRENGVTIKTYGTNDSHKPAHAHVSGKDGHVRIGANGKPLKGEPELSTKQKKVVKHYKKEIRKEVNAIGKENKKIEEYGKNK